HGRSIMFRASDDSSSVSELFRRNASTRMAAPERPRAIGPTMRDTSAMATLRDLLAAMPDDPTSFDEITRSFSTERWSALLSEPLEHHVLRLIWPHLDRAIVPEPVLNAFSYRWTILAAIQELVVSSFESVASAFERKHLRVCALKGPVLSA